MTMYDLPGTAFRPKDACRPESDWRDLLASANLDLEPLYLDDVRKVGSHILRYVLKASDFTISIIRCGTFHGLSSLLPSMRDRAEWGKGVSETYVFSVGEQLLIRLGISFQELTCR